MVNLFEEYLKAIQFKITDGSEFLWKCYGPNARFLESIDDNFHVSAIYDTVDQTVYEIAISSTYEGDVRYKWFNPDYLEAYQAEANEREIQWDQCFDDERWAITESFDDILDKVTKILAGEEYDDRVIMKLDLGQDVIDRINQTAEMLGITPDELVTQILTQMVNEGLEQE